MGKSWFRTADQDKYLEEQVKELIKARLDDTVKSFRHQLYEIWEARWPEIEVLYPQRTDADPPLTKEQLDELSKAMSSRKLVSLNVCCDYFHTEIPSIATIYPRSLARWYKAYPYKKSQNPTRALSSQRPGEEGDAKTINPDNI